MRACQHFGLACNARRPFDSTHLQSLLKPGQQLRVLTQLQSERFGHHLPRDIVRRWTKSPGYEKNFAMRKQFSERAPDRLGVRHRAPFQDP